MNIYFDNNGLYGKNAVNIPVTVNGKPIGFVSEVNQERVTLYIWDRFVNEEVLGINMYTKEQDVRTISIEA